MIRAGALASQGIARGPPINALEPAPPCQLVLAPLGSSGCGPDPPEEGTTPSPGLSPGGAPLEPGS
eukprot:6272473-Alexandrium_andersonii.AAC.1